jgi:phosphoribosylamine--glycine ligase
MLPETSEGELGWFLNNGEDVRLLGIGNSIELSDLYLTLMGEGHEVRVFAGAESHRGTLDGLIAPVPDWQAELPWVGTEGIVLFETVGLGEIQDRLRTDGYTVIGGSGFGDRLENDRAFGQALLAGAGLPVAASRAFDTPQAAAHWLSANPGRYVLKYDRSAFPTFVGEHPEGADVLFRLNRSAPGRVLLMDALEGVEVGVGAYFDGEKFLRPACIDFEHKRFFPGDMGEMTGEMGTLAGFEGAERLFDATLGRTAAAFAEAGHVGYINLNLIVNEDGVWPLEFTCRFGYPGYAVLAPLQSAGWADLLGRIQSGNHESFPTLPGWSVAIVLTIPPFPHGPDRTARPENDPPIFFRVAPDPAERLHYRLMDVRRAGSQLFARRHTGYSMVVTGIGSTVEEAQNTARSRARNVIVPDIRWRGDIGARFIEKDRARLQTLGWLP